MSDAERPSEPSPQAADKPRGRGANLWMLWTAILATGLGSAVWLAQLEREEESPAAASSAPPATHVGDFHYREFSPSGALRYRVHARQAQHFGAEHAADGRAYITLRDSTLTRWGREGDISNDISLPSMTVWPDTLEVRSDARVHLRWHGRSGALLGELSAVGMHMSMREQRIVLRSAVRSRYQRSSAAKPLKPPKPTASAGAPAAR